MNFVLAVMIPYDEKDVITYITAILDPYYADKQISPRKEYIDDDLLEDILVRYNLDRSDHMGVVKSLEEWTENEAGIDEGGIYYMNTSNDHGKWDGWIFADIEKDMYATIDDLYTSQIAIDAVVSLAGKWYDLDFRAPTTIDDFKKIAMNSDAFIIATVYCHI